MPAFELAAAELASATGTTSARPAARTAPPIHVFMRTMSSCEQCLHASAPPDGLISHARQARGLRACHHSLAHRQLVLPVVPVAMMMPMIAPVVVVAPVHLGGDVLGVILHRGGAAGTGQR